MRERESEHTHTFGVDISEARFDRAAGQSIIAVRDEQKVWLYLVQIWFIW